MYRENFVDGCGQSVLGSLHGACLGVPGVATGEQFSNLSGGPWEVSPE